MNSEFLSEKVVTNRHFRFEEIELVDELKYNELKRSAMYDKLTYYEKDQMLKYHFVKYVKDSIGIDRTEFLWQICCTEGITKFRIISALIAKSRYDIDVMKVFRVNNILDCDQALRFDAIIKLLSCFGINDIKNEILIDSNSMKEIIDKLCPKLYDQLVIVQYGRDQSQSKKASSEDLKHMITLFNRFLESSTDSKLESKQRFKKIAGKTSNVGTDYIFTFRKRQSKNEKRSMIDDIKEHSFPKKEEICLESLV